MTAAQITSEIRGEVVHVAVAGEIDLANAARVQRGIYETVTNDVTCVVLDLAALEYLDSAGLRVLFTLAERLRVLQIRLDLVVPPGSRVRRVVEMSGLDPVARVLRDSPGT